MTGNNSTTSSPVFVVGSPRTGTHLLRFCLGRHPNVFMLPETGYFWKVYGNRRLAGPNPAAHARYFVERIGQSGDPSMDDLRPQFDAVAAAIRDSATSYADFLEVFARFFAEPQGKARWGEKTPLHIFYVREIRRLFPGATILCMRRDPRNVLASYLRSRHLPDSLAQGLATILLCAEYEKRWAQHLVMVDYEDLISRPEETLTRCADAIGEKFHPDMLMPGMIDSSYGGEVMQREASIGIVRDENESEKWRKVLSDDQVRNLERALAGESLPPGLALRVRTSMLRFRLSIAKNAAGLEDVKHWRRWRT